MFGEYVLVATERGDNNTLHIIDFSDPANPREVSAYKKNRWFARRAPRILGHRVFLKSHAVDIADPLEPKPDVAASIEFEDVAFHQNTAYAIGNYGLRVYDFTSEIPVLQGEAQFDWFYHK